MSFLATAGNLEAKTITQSDASGSEDLGLEHNSLETDWNVGSNMETRGTIQRNVEAMPLGVIISC